MGDRTYKEADLLATKRARADKSGDVFAQTKKMRETPAGERKVHEKLSIAEPYRRIRESRDSASNPKSSAVVAAFDVTGSQRNFPREVEANVKDLMAYLVRSKYLPFPAVLFAVVGDSDTKQYAGRDEVPLQMGQFESGGEELMNFFQWVYLEGGGKGNGGESYQNLFYFLARHTKLDCFEKRGKKGYCLLTLDEPCHPEVVPEEIKDLMGGVGPERPIPTPEIIKEAQKMYVTFAFLPRETQGGEDPRIWKIWRSLLGEEYVLGIDRADQICEFFGTTIGVCEGKVTPEKAVENLQRKNVSEEYLAIALASYRKVYGINKEKAVSQKSSDQPAAKKKDDKGPKKPLKI